MHSLKEELSDISHTPVMLNEMLEYLTPKFSEHYLDVTFGAGGYSKAILDSCDCRVTAIDRDPTTNLYAQKLKEQYRERFNYLNMSFAESIEKFQEQEFNGIVMDLGVSSMQLDEADRGFSFLKDGPLDMRMSNNGRSAADFINYASEKEIADIIYQYGDEHESRKIARFIVNERLVKPIISTLQLASIVRRAKPSRGKIDSATKTFQAIRIDINEELGQLSKFLNGVKNILKPRGRLIVVSFHSLEDRIVKQFIKAHSPKKVSKSKYSVSEEIIDPNHWIKALNKRPITPSPIEIKSNVRSRSAKLRAIIKDEKIQ